MISFRGFYTIIISLLVLSATTGVLGQQISNPSFERNRFQVWPGYCSDNGGGLWNWVVWPPDRGGINPVFTTTVDSPFANNGAIPEGDMVAFIQSTDGAVSSLSSTITDLIPGTRYRIQVRVNARYGIDLSVPDMTMTVDQFPILEMSAPVMTVAGDMTPAYLLVSGFFMATNSTAELAVSCMAAGDGALLLDDFQIAALPENYISVLPWQDSASTGISKDDTIMVYTFGAADDDLENGMIGGTTPAVVGEFSVLGMTGYYADENNLMLDPDIAGLASDFIFGGNPGSLTVENLIPGLRYRLSLLGIGFDYYGNRYITFAAGSDALVVDESQFGNNNGIRIDYNFNAAASSQTISFTPYNTINTFHLYGFVLTALDSPLVIESQPEDHFVFAGTSISLSAVVTGYPSPTYQWYSDVDGLLVNETNNILAWSSVKVADSGNYYMIASNRTGCVTSQVACISVQGHTLKSQAISVGSSTTFTSGLSNATNYTYRWLFNGEEIHFLPTISTYIGAEASGASGINLTLSNPLDLDMGPDGTMYIQQQNPSEIRTISPSGVDSPLSAYFSQLNSFCVDLSGNVFCSQFSDAQIYKINPRGEVSTYAGTGAVGYSGDGASAVNAQINYPYDLCCDPAGNLYFSSQNNVIRKVSTNGVISTVTSILYPYALALDASENLYVSSLNATIYKVRPDGSSTVVAGNGSSGHSGDGGLATDAQIYAVDLATDDFGNLYFSETSENYIRKVSPDGIISSVAGSSTLGYSGDGGLAVNALLRRPRGIVCDDANNLLFVDVGNACVRKIQLISGPSLYIDQATTNDFGDYQLAITDLRSGSSSTSSVFTLSEAYLDRPVIDVDHAIVFAQTGIQWTASADGDPEPTYQWHSSTSGLLTGETNNTLSLDYVSAADAGDYYVIASNCSGSTTSLVETLSVIDHSVSSQAVPVGSSVTFSCSLADISDYTYQWLHNGEEIVFQKMTSLAVSGELGSMADSTHVYNPVDVAVGPDGSLFVLQNFGGLNVISPNGVYASHASMGSGAMGICIDSVGNQYISSVSSNVVYKRTVDGLISFYVGTGDDGYSGDGGLATEAELQYPQDVCFDAVGNLYVSDYYSRVIRKVAVDGTISTYWANLNDPQGICVDSAGNVYVCDRNYVKKRTPEGIVTIVAGNGVAGYAGDGGSALSAQMDTPRNVIVDDFGNLFISDAGNHCIRTVTPDGIISTFAQVSFPLGLAFDPVGNLLVVDYDSHRIQKIYDGTTPDLLLDNVSTNDFGSYQLIMTEVASRSSITSTVFNLSQAFSTPLVLSNAMVSAQNFCFEVSGEVGRRVLVESSTNLTGGVWVPVQTNTLGTSPLLFNAPVQPQQSCRFYRLRAQ